MELNYPDNNNTTTEWIIDITKIKHLVSEDDYKTISEIQNKYPNNTDETQSKNIDLQDKEKIIDIITECYNKEEAKKTAEWIKQKIDAFFKKTTKIGETGGREAIRNNSDRKIALSSAEWNQTLINFAEDLTKFLSEEYKINPKINIKIINFENIPYAFWMSHKNTIYINSAKRKNLQNKGKISCFMNIYAHEFCHILDEKGLWSLDPVISQLWSKYYISSWKYYQKNPIEETAHLTWEIVSGKKGYGTPNDQWEGIGEERKQDLIQEIVKKEQEEKNKEIEKQEKFNQYLKELNLKIWETLWDTAITSQDIENLKSNIKQKYIDGIPSGEIIFQWHTIHLDTLLNDLNFSNKPIKEIFQTIQNQQQSEAQKEYARERLLPHIVAKILVETDGWKKEQRKENILNAIVIDGEWEKDERKSNTLCSYIISNYVTRDDIAYQIAQNRRKHNGIGTVKLNSNDTVYINALQNTATTTKEIKDAFSDLINQYNTPNLTEQEKEKLDTQLAELIILTENTYQTQKEITKKNKYGLDITTQEYDSEQRDRVIRIDNPNNEKQPTTDELDTQRKECYQGLQELWIPVKKIKLQHDNETYRIIMKQSTYNQLLNIKEDEQQESPSEGEIQPQAPQGETTTPTSQEENKTEQPKQPKIPQEDPIKKEGKIKEKSESKEQGSSPEIAERLLLANFISKRRRESQNGNIKNQYIRLNDDYDINITESKVYYIPRNKQGETIERPFRFIEHIRNIINHSASNQEKDQRLMEYDIEMAERIILGLPKGIIEILPSQWGEEEAQKIVDWYKNDPVTEIRDLEIIELPNGNIWVQKREKKTNI